MTKIDLSNPYTSEPVKKKVQKYGGRPFGLENYCSGYCNGVKTLQQYPIINSKGKKSSAKDCFGKPRDFYEVSSTVYPESECAFVERMPSNTQNTLLNIKHSTREHIIYQDGREEIILDKPELRRVREKLNGKFRK